MTKSAKVLAFSHSIYERESGEHEMISLRYLRDGKTHWVPLVKTRPAFSPRTAKTLLSDKELERHGLCYMTGTDAQSWIIPVDADNLVDEPFSHVWIDALKTRIAQLHEISAEEELPYSDRSAEYALSFAKSVSASVRPSAFLIGNGNTRLLWTLEEEQIGLQFLPNGMIQYVMFVKRGEQIAPHMGSDDASTILGQISALGLRHLLNS